MITVSLLVLLDVLHKLHNIKLNCPGRGQPHNKVNIRFPTPDRYFYGRKNVHGDISEEADNKEGKSETQYRDKYET